MTTDHDDALATEPDADGSVSEDISSDELISDELTNDDALTTEPDADGSVSEDISSD